MTMEDLNDIFDEEQNTNPGENLDQNISDSTISNDDLFNGDDNEPISQESVLDDYLKSIGIEEGKITIIDENNEEKEVSFYDLDKSEQLEILNPPVSEKDTSLDSTELELIDHLRSNNLSLDDFLENYKQSIVESLEKPEQTYDIDSYDDQELYLLDLKNKYDLTDEELEKELEKELQNEDLFKKKLDALRADYKNLEDEYNEAQRIESEKEKEEDYSKFTDEMVNIAVATPEFYGIELEDDEKNEVLSFLLDLDDNGTSEFYNTLNDPKKLYEAAWFLRYGKESFDALKNAYESEITKMKKPDKPQAIRRNKASDGQKIENIHDLNF